MADFDDGNNGKSNDKNNNDAPKGNGQGDNFSLQQKKLNEEAKKEKEQLDKRRTVKLSPEEADAAAQNVGIIAELGTGIFGGKGNTLDAKKGDNSLDSHTTQGQTKNNYELLEGIARELENTKPGSEEAKKARVDAENAKKYLDDLIAVGRIATNKNDQLDSRLNYSDSWDNSKLEGSAISMDSETQRNTEANKASVTEEKQEEVQSHCSSNPTPAEPGNKKNNTNHDVQEASIEMIAKFSPSLVGTFKPLNDTEQSQAHYAILRTSNTKDMNGMSPKPNNNKSEDLSATVFLEDSAKEKAEEAKSNNNSPTLVELAKIRQKVIDDSKEVVKIYEKIDPIRNYKLHRELETFLISHKAEIIGLTNRKTHKVITTQELNKEDLYGKLENFNKELIYIQNLLSEFKTQTQAQAKAEAEKKQEPVINATVTSKKTIDNRRVAKRLRRRSNSVSELKPHNKVDAVTKYTDDINVKTNNNNQNIDPEYNDLMQSIVNNVKKLENKVDLKSINPELTTSVQFNALMNSINGYLGVDNSNTKLKAFTLSIVEEKIKKNLPSIENQELNQQHEAIKADQIKLLEEVNNLLNSINNETHESLTNSTSSVGSQNEQQEKTTLTASEKLGQAIEEGKANPQPINKPKAKPRESEKSETESEISSSDESIVTAASGSTNVSYQTADSSVSAPIVESNTNVRIEPVAPAKPVEPAKPGLFERFTNYIESKLPSMPSINLFGSDNVKIDLNIADLGQKQVFEASSEISEASQNSSSLYESAKTNDSELTNSLNGSFQESEVFSALSKSDEAALNASIEPAAKKQEEVKQESKPGLFSRAFTGVKKLFSKPEASPTDAELLRRSTDSKEDSAEFNDADSQSSSASKASSKSSLKQSEIFTSLSKSDEAALKASIDSATEKQEEVKQESKPGLFSRALTGVKKLFSKPEASPTDAELLNQSTNSKDSAAFNDADSQSSSISKASSKSSLKESEVFSALSKSDEAALNASIEPVKPTLEKSETQEEIDNLDDSLSVYSAEEEQNSQEEAIIPKDFFKEDSSQGSNKSNKEEFKQENKPGIFGRMFGWTKDLFKAKEELNKNNNASEIKSEVSSDSESNYHDAASQLSESLQDIVDVVPNQVPVVNPAPAKPGLVSRAVNGVKNLLGLGSNNVNPAPVVQQPAINPVPVVNPAPAQQNNNNAPSVVGFNVQPAPQPGFLASTWNNIKNYWNGNNNVKKPEPVVKPVNNTPSVVGFNVQPEQKQEKGFFANLYDKVSNFFNNGVDNTKPAEENVTNHVKVEKEQPKNNFNFPVNKPKEEEKSDAEVKKNEAVKKPAEEKPKTLDLNKTNNQVNANKRPNGFIEALKWIAVVLSLFILLPVFLHFNVIKLNDSKKPENKPQGNVNQNVLKGETRAQVLEKNKRQNRVSALNAIKK